jgi:hypothetical protein
VGRHESPQARESKAGSGPYQLLSGQHQGSIKSLVGRRSYIAQLWWLSYYISSSCEAQFSRARYTAVQGGRADLTPGRQGANELHSSERQQTIWLWFAQYPLQTPKTSSHGHDAGGFVVSFAGKSTHSSKKRPILIINRIFRVISSFCLFRFGRAFSNTGKHPETRRNVVSVISVMKPRISAYEKPVLVAITRNKNNVFTDG